MPEKGKRDYMNLQGKIRAKYDTLSFGAFIDWVISDLQNSLGPSPEGDSSYKLDPHWKPYYNK